jgi:predicted Zn-dependent protease with MMP-like domain
MLVILIFFCVVYGLYFVWLNWDAKKWLLKHSPNPPDFLAGMGVERPMNLVYTEEEFELFVASAIDSLSSEVRKKLDGVEIVIDVWPDQELSTRYEKDGNVLLGCYIGVGLVKYGASRSIMPRVIKIFQGPIEMICRHRQDIEEQVAKTLMHEVGHHLGMDHDQLREIGL